MALPPAPEFGVSHILALVFALVGFGSGLVLLRPGLGRRRVPMAVGGALLSVTMVVACLPLLSGLAQLVQGEAVVHDRPYSDGGHMVAYPDGRVVEFVATPDAARSQICLQQPFECPSMIIIQTLGKEARTFKKPLPEVFASPPSEWTWLDCLPYHTCEVVDGQPVARVQVRAIKDLT